MQDFNFKAHDSKVHRTVPYIEDARAKDLPGYASRRTQEQLKSLCIGELQKLSAKNIMFEAGDFQEEPLRVGFMVQFTIDGVQLKVPLVGAKMRHRRNTEKVQKQVLYAFYLYLQGYNSILNNLPGHAPFVQHMVMESGQTLIQYLRSERQLPIQINPLLP